MQLDDNAGGTSGGGVETVLPGDANLDGQVDINDLTIVLAHYDRTGLAWAQGEFTGDGTVDINDLTIVLARYGQTVDRPRESPRCRNPAYLPCWPRDWPACWLMRGASGSQNRTSAQRSPPTARPGGESGWAARTQPVSNAEPHPARPGGESGWLGAAYCCAQSAAFFTRVTGMLRGDGFLFPLSYSACFTIGTRPNGTRLRPRGVRSSAFRRRFYRISG